MIRRVARILAMGVVVTVLIGPLPLMPTQLPSPTAQVPDDWLSAVHREIQGSEYEITWQDHVPVANLASAYHAPNRAHNLRTYFTPTAIHVVPRTGDASAWRWGLRLRGWDTGRLVVTGNRIENRRDGITEWYVNDERGLEQGFTLETQPAEAAASGVIQIDMDVLGTLTPTVARDGATVEFATTGGVQVLRYGQVIARDARGRLLVSRLSQLRGTSAATGPRIRITVEATGAAYPVVIDPVATSPAWMAESNQAGAYFGTSVATAGDVNGDGYSDVIVGAPGYDNGQADEGRIFIYKGSATGLSLSHIWARESNQAGAFFGVSVATAGDVNGDGYGDVIIGASSFDNGQTDEGRAFVFHGSSTGPSAAPSWTAESNQASANFGASVASAGDVNGDGYGDVIVGAYRYDNGQVDEGRAVVYHGSVSGLSPTPNWTAESNQASAFFGASAATAGDVNGDGYGDVIVGAYAFDNGQTDEGKAYVYHGSATGLSAAANWTKEGNLPGGFGIGFAWSVATAGDVNGDGYSDVIIGFPYYANGQFGEGRAYVYKGTAAGLQGNWIWTFESNQDFGLLGNSVATAGDVNGDGYSDIIVGHLLYANGQFDEGRALVFQGSPTGPSLIPIWTAEGNQDSAEFGHAVATAGDVNGDGYSDIVVGSRFYDNGQGNEGRAFVYYGSSSRLSETISWTAERNQPGASFGNSVASAGDVNGDGFGDIIIGAYLYDSGQVDEGRVFAYYGSASGLSLNSNWTVESDQAFAYFGNGVATAGDVNGDGYSDVIVGAFAYDNGQTDEGRAFVYYGSASGLSTVANWTAESNQAGAFFGNAVATAGDVNGDGYSDVIVGAQFYDNGQVDEGRIYVYKGSAAGLSLSPNWVRESNQAGAHFGVRVATAGDVNRDGYSDVLVSAPAYDNGQTDEGRVFLHYGSTAGISAAPNWTQESNQAGARFGDALATAGDVNGDGYSDIIVGAPQFKSGIYTVGAAFVYHGSGTGPSTTVPNWFLISNTANSEFGGAVATAGDLNGDGYSDIVIGFPGPGGDFVSVWHGSAGGLSTSIWGMSSQNGSRFGASVAAGDVNGDGYSDVLIGAPVFDNGEVDEGKVFMFYGNAGRNMTLRPRQRRASNGAPIDYLGKSDSSSSFILALLLRTPYGRGRARLEAEVKPLGTPFNGSGLQVSGWTNTGVLGNNMNKLITGLSPATNYHWRVRIRYHPATTPFQLYSRWLTIPWNGRNEKDLRTP